MLNANIHILYFGIVEVCVNYVWLCLVLVPVLCRCSTSAHCVIFHEVAVDMGHFVVWPVLFCFPILIPVWCCLVGSLGGLAWWAHWSRHSDTDLLFVLCVLGILLSTAVLLYV